MGTGELLDFERAWPRHSGAKENAIIERGLTPARYYVLLHRAAASLDGQSHDAMTAHRVLREVSTSSGLSLPTFCPQIHGNRWVPVGLNGYEKPRNHADVATIPQ